MLMNSCLRSSSFCNPFSFPDFPDSRGWAPSPDSWDRAGAGSYKDAMSRRQFARVARFRRYKSNFLWGQRFGMFVPVGFGPSLASTAKPSPFF
jgi:hypothetical protein